MIFLLSVLFSFVGFPDIISPFPITRDAVIVWATNQGQPEGEPLAEVSVGKKIILFIFNIPDIMNRYDHSRYRYRKLD